jgi:hypothetical protein
MSKHTRCAIVVEKRNIHRVKGAIERGVPMVTKTGMGMTMAFVAKMGMGVDKGGQAMVFRGWPRKRGGLVEVGVLRGWPRMRGGLLGVGVF